MVSNHDELRQAMKAGKARLHAGDLDKAERHFLRALELVNDYGGKYSGKGGIVNHRLADIAALRGESNLARRRFMKSTNLIKATDQVGLAMALRDSGNFELLDGHERSARRLVMQALDILQGIKKPSDRETIELIVTHGFMARIDLGHPKRRRQAIKALRDVDNKLMGYKKPIYELANLAWLINALPPGIERQRLTMRAIRLCIKLGNYKRTAEFTVLLGGGKPSRHVFRLVF